jgi:hypothetical protein
MDPGDALLTVGELALGLAGFSGIVAAFRTRTGPWHPADAFRLTSLLLVSLGTFFLALIPLALSQFALSYEVVWRVSSGLMALFIGVAGFIILRKLRTLDAGSRLLFNRWMNAFMLIGSLLTGLAQLANSVGAISRDWFAVYFAGTVWLLFYSGVQFARLVLIRPQAE